MSGATYRGANDEFKNAQVVMYVSGLWQIGQFDKTIGDAFDWVAVPNPCGPEDAPACRAARPDRDQDDEGPEGSRPRVDYLASEAVSRNSTSARCSCPAISALRSGVSTTTAIPHAKAALTGLRRGRCPDSRRWPTSCRAIGITARCSTR